MSAQMSGRVSINSIIPTSVCTCAISGLSLCATCFLYLSLFNSAAYIISEDQGGIGIKDKIRGIVIEELTSSGGTSQSDRAKS